MPSSKKSVKKAAKKKLAKKKTTKKSTKKVSKRGEKKFKEEVMGLAHTGTKEGLQKLNDIIKKTTDEDLKDFAMLAREECEMHYCFPESEQEEKDLLLAKMIYETQESIDKLFQKGQSAQFELDRLKLDRAVYKKILRSKKNKKFEHQFSEDYYNMVKNRLSEIEEEMDYKLLWVDEAKKMIKTEKYHDVSARVFECLCYDDEDNFWDDEWNDGDVQEFNYDLDKIMENEEFSEEMF